jgi:hypothetical protein
VYEIARLIFSEAVKPLVVATKPVNLFCPAFIAGR